MKRLTLIFALAIFALPSLAAAAPPKAEQAPTNMVTPEDVKNPKVVFHMKSNVLNETGIPYVIELAARINNYYKSKKIDAKIKVIVQDEAAYWMLNDTTFKKEKKGASNKAGAMIESLIQDGVEFEICMFDLKKHSWKPDQLQAGVRPLMGALPRLIELQSKGWVYLSY